MLSLPKGKSDMSNFLSLVEIMSRLRGEGGRGWGRGHPHVFSDASAATPDAVSLQWEQIKKTMENRNHASLVGGVPRSFPSLLRAAKITKQASRAGFDWENNGPVLKKVGEEMEELK